MHGLCACPFASVQQGVCVQSKTTGKQSETTLTKRGGVVAYITKWIHCALATAALRLT